MEEEGPLVVVTLAVAGSEELQVGWGRLEAMGGGAGCGPASRSPRQGHLRRCHSRRPGRHCHGRQPLAMTSFAQWQAPLGAWRV